MFCWTDDMISFMQDAANFGSYQQELADWICGALPAVRHVCDAGCGLGFLSVRLAERFETVTAADISGQDGGGKKNLQSANSRDRHDDVHAGSAV